MTYFVFSFDNDIYSMISKDKFDLISIRYKIRKNKADHLNKRTRNLGNTPMLIEEDHISFHDLFI